MKTFVPNYYDNFKCIADKCEHSCCIGWEIDIDKKALDFYKSVNGSFGKKLEENISKEKEPHFILGKGDRCPFLNSQNLCDIYIELGEKSLCQICADHPRFRNFFESRTEIGLGMCCEAVTQLILNYQNKMTLIQTQKSKCDDTTSEEVFFNLRQKAFDILQDRSVCIDNRIFNLRKEFDLKVPERSFGEWIDFYLTLENLDIKWKELLREAKDRKICKNICPNEEKWQIAFEQLAVYFVFRHTADAVFENNLNIRLSFALLSFEMVKNLCLMSKKPSIEMLCDIARMYSAEIEYSEDNIDELIFELENELF